MENVTYFFRNRKEGFSIKKAFDPILRLRKVAEAQIVEMPSHRAMPIELLKNMIYAYRHRNRSGINHITGACNYIIMALPHCKKVLTVHDAGHYIHATNPFKKFILRWMWFRLPLKYADAITCISEKTKKEILKYFPVDPLKVKVVGDCYDPSLTYTPKIFNKECPDILHVGTAPHKNLARVVEALADIPCHLTIVGPIDKETEAVLKEKRISYTLLTNLTDEEIANCYRKCDIVSFPSLFEGFGMPIIEGKAVGRPVLTSNIEPMKTIADGSCCIVDPLSVESIRKGFLRIIDDDAYRELCVRQSLENVKKYSVERISEEYHQIYTSITE